MYPPKRRSAWVSLTRLGILSVALAAFITSRSFAAPGDLYVTDLASGSVIVYTPAGVGTTFTSGLTSPQGITFDQAKNLYVVDAGDGGVGSGTIFKYDLPTRTQTTVRSNLNNPTGLAFDGSDLMLAEKGSGRVLRVPVDGIHPPSIFKVITAPLAVTSEAFNQLGFFRFISNTTAVTEVGPDGTTTNIDFGGGGSRGLAVNSAGDLFVSTDAGTVVEVMAGGSTDTTFGSGFTQPTGMDFRPARFGGDTDKVGFLYVADTGAGEIGQITQAGVMSTFVTGAGSPNYMVFEVNSPSPSPTPTPSPSPEPVRQPDPDPDANSSRQGVTKLDPR